jgi:hypothetical protein
MIDPASIGSSGRKVRCARCKSSWLAGGPTQNSDVQSFVKDVIAEAETKQDGAAAMDSRGPAGQPTSIPDDFGAEPHRPVGRAPETFESAESHRWPSPEHAADGAAVSDPVAVPESPSIVPPQDHAPLLGTITIPNDHEDVETFAARRERMRARRTRTRRASKWTALVLVLLGLNIALVGARNDVVRYLPQTASLFSMIGLPVNLRNMSFENVKVFKETVEGVAVLLVEGEIVSAARSPVEVPRLRFAIRNKSGQEIYAWTALATRSILAPGERLPFRSRLASPPADSSDVLVRFSNARDTTLGSK